MMNVYSIFLALFISSLAMARTTYILGIDGLSYESLLTAQKMGMFKQIKSVSAHIASFPTMTDLVWSDVFQTQKIFGQPGRIQSVEAVYFDDSSKKIKGDVRDYYRRLAQPKYYMNGFEFLFNPYVEALMYFPTKEMSRVEVKSVIDGMLSAQGKTLVTGYIGAVDSTAHTQENRLYPVLKDVDVGLSRLINTLNERNEDYEIFLVSDHGNVGNFVEGSEETALTPINIEEFLNNSEFQLVDKITKSGDIAIPRLALGTWAPVYFYDSKQIESLIQILQKQTWFDLSVQLIENSRNQILLKITGQNGSAYVGRDKSNRYYYESLTGNPLQVNQEIISTSVQKIYLSENQIELYTRSTQYPDSIIRLVESVANDNFDFPDLILTLKDGFFINNSFSGMTKMFRTHGSLTRKASLGILASTNTKLPQYVRSNEIFQTIGILPDLTFGKIGQDSKKQTSDVVNQLLQNKTNKIQTGARQFNEKRIFRMLTKPVALSRPYFVASEIEDILKAFGVNIGGLGQSQRYSIGMGITQKFDFTKAVTPEEIGALTDLAIRNPDIEALKNHPQVKTIVNRLLDAKAEEQADVNLDQYKPQSIAGKRIAMKVYQIPHLLDQALNFPEKTEIPDTRDAKFAQYWNQYRDILTRSSVQLNKSYQDNKWAFWEKGSDSIPQRLFREVLKEAEIEDKIDPQDLENIYRRLPENTTVVYVPGTYNGIFDDEIFSLGMLSIKEDLGLRTLTAPIKSACSADVNGQILLNFLKNDQAQFRKRKQAPPRYLLMGYSKGALDALNTLVLDKNFAMQSVVGLMAIAAPLKGSPILGKADLPFVLVNMLIDEETPEVCKSSKTATSSGGEQATQKFWRQNERDLVGLTRYYSVSFVSEPEESHIIMKITKLITQFDEDNDGIIPLSSSRFPPSLSAVDLGVVRADHLAGILSSRFNQRAFMRALVRTLGELKVTDVESSKRWRAESLATVMSQFYQSPNYAAWNKDKKMVQILEANNKETVTYNDPYEINLRFLKNKKDPISSYEPQVQLSSNQLGFELDTALDVAKIPVLLSDKKVSPTLPSASKKVIDLSFDHEDVRHYRIDHQWFYESRSPVGGDNNLNWGFQTTKGPDGKKWLAMRSTNNSIRLTTLSHRFRPADYPKFDLDLIVTKGPKGADPVLGKSGKDDSSFQVWFTLRDLNGVKDRSLGEKEDTRVYTFGYYWGEEIPGETRNEGQIFENTFSNKNVVIAKLPPAFQLVLNSGNQNLGKPVNYKRNLFEDIKKAYPNLITQNLEVIAITLQMDSNDTSSQTEAFFKTLRLSSSELAMEKLASRED
jgi:hypothetical protein